MKKLPPHFKAKWIEALRSGDYAQIGEFLRTNDGYCCLGVACHLYDPNQWNLVRVPLDLGSAEYELVYQSTSGARDLPRDGDLDQEVFAALSQHIGATTKSVMYEIADMNDRGYTFGEIANWIEEHL